MQVKLKNYYSKYRGLFILACILTIIWVMISMLVPMILAFTVDGVLLGQEPALPGFLLKIYHNLGREYFLARLWIPGLLMIIRYIIGASIMYLRNICAATFAQTGTEALRNALFRQLQLLPVAWHKQIDTGDLIQRCTSDVRQINHFFHRQIMHILQTVTTLLMATILMLSFDWRLGLIPLALAPLVVVISTRYYRSRFLAWELWEEAEADLSARLQETITGIRVVKAFGREDYEYKEFKTKNQYLYNYGLDVFRKMANFWFELDIITQGEIGIILVLGSLMAYRGTITPGTLLLFIFYSDKVIKPLRIAARAITATSTVKVAWQRLQEILGAQAEADESHLQKKNLKGNIRFENVSFSYPDGDETVLKNLNFTINAGENIGILGPTASGKSSLLLLLQKIYDADSGTIYFDDIPIDELDREQLRQEVGLILQESFIFSRSIKKNIAIAVDNAVDSEIQQAAKSARLHNDINQFKQGYETLVGERGVTLSGGQKQRLAIARSLIRSCPILIFDDSLSAVDPMTDKQIRNELQKRQQNLTTIIVSHRVSTLMECDRILILNHGQIEAFATPSELMRQDGLFKRIYEMQMNWEEAQ